MLWGNLKHCVVSSCQAAEAAWASTHRVLVLKPPGDFQSSSIQLMLAFQSVAAWCQSHQRAAPDDKLNRDPSWDHREELPCWLHYTGRKTIKMGVCLCKKKKWVPLKVISDTHEKLWKISTNFTDAEMAFCRGIWIKKIPPQGCICPITSGPAEMKCLGEEMGSHQQDISGHRFHLTKPKGTVSPHSFNKITNIPWTVS